MLGSMRLQDVPATFFDAKKWDALRSSAPNELTALCCLNASYPDPVDPCDPFCAHGRPLNKTVKLYSTGRSLVNDYRLLLLKGKHVATGVGPDGKRVKIPALAWINLWPLFATGRANGPGIIFNEIEIYETDQRKLEQDCRAGLSPTLNLPARKSASFMTKQSSRSETSSPMPYLTRRTNKYSDASGADRPLSK